MCPPSIVRRVVRPAILIIKAEKIAVRTVSRNICSLRIAFLILIDPLSVHPFIKGTAVIKHSVKDNLHASLVNLLCQLCKQLVAGFQISFVCYTADIFPCM